MEKNAEKNFECEICEKRFSNEQIKNRHVTIVHGENKNFICNVCDIKFGLQNGLKLHIENNHQGGSNICNLC